MVSFSELPISQLVLTSHVKNLPTLSDPGPKVPKTLTPAGSPELSYDADISQPKPVQPPGTTDVPCRNVLQESLLSWEPVNERLITAKCQTRFVKMTIIQCHALPIDKDKDAFCNNLSSLVNK